MAEFFFMDKTFFFIQSANETTKTIWIYQMYFVIFTDL